jgi:CheY-like chemotaxis protein
LQSGADIFEPDIEKVILNSKILVAEDNKVNQMVVANVLRKIGCEFDIAENGEIACEKYAQGDYFLILMDLMMPVMDGFEATKTIRSTSKFAIKRPHIAALTASVSEGEMKLAREAGCMEIISKPVSLERLRAAVRCAALAYAK